MTYKNGWIVTGLIILVPALAGADVPPPAGYVEQCSIQKQQKAGEFCVLRRAWHGDYWGCKADKVNLPRDEKVCGNYDKGTRQQCCKGWLAAGWRKRCKTRGASAFGMLWCRARKAGDPPPPPVVPVKKKDGCSVASSSGGPAAVTLLLIALALAAMRRSRRR